MSYWSDVLGNTAKQITHCSVQMHNVHQDRVRALEAHIAELKKELRSRTQVFATDLQSINVTISEFREATQSQTKKEELLRSELYKARLDSEQLHERVRGLEDTCANYDTVLSKLSLGLGQNPVSQAPVGSSIPSIDTTESILESAMYTGNPDCQTMADSSAAWLSKLYAKAGLSKVELFSESNTSTIHTNCQKQTDSTAQARLSIPSLDTTESILESAMYTVGADCQDEAGSLGSEWSSIPSTDSDTESVLESVMSTVSTHSRTKADSMAPVRLSNPSPDMTQSVLESAACVGNPDCQTMADSSAAWLSKLYARANPADLINWSKTKSVHEQ